MKLILVVKKKWFDMIASGEKTEEYRECKSYWIKRFEKMRGVPKEELKVEFRLGYQKNAKGIEFNITKAHYIFDRKDGESRGLKLKPEWGYNPDMRTLVLAFERSNNAA